MLCWSGKAGEALENIIKRVNNISELMSDIAQSATDQSAGLAEINSSVVQLDQVTQANAAMVEESTAAGQMLANDASELTDMMASFKTTATVTGNVKEVNAPDTPEPIAKDAVAPETTTKVPVQRNTVSFVADANAAVDLEEWENF